MAEQHKTRCPGCRQFLPGMPDPDDYGDNERAYHQDVDRRWELHDCPALEGTGPARKDGPAGRPAGRPGKGKATGKVRNYRFLCACEPPFIIRSGRRDLDARCYACGGRFEWEPSDSEYTGDIKEAV